MAVLLEWTIFREVNFLYLSPGPPSLVELRSSGGSGKMSCLGLYKLLPDGGAVGQQSPIYRQEYERSNKAHYLYRWDIIFANICHTAQCSRYWLGVALNRTSWDISQIITFDGPFPKIFVFTRSNKSKVEKTSFSWSSNSNFAIWRIKCSSSSYKRIICSCSIYLEHLKIHL